MEDEFPFDDFLLTSAYDDDLLGLKEEDNELLEGENNNHNSNNPLWISESILTELGSISTDPIDPSTAAGMQNMRQTSEAGQSMVGSQSNNNNNHQHHQHQPPQLQNVQTLSSEGSHQHQLQFHNQNQNQAQTFGCSFTNPPISGASGFEMGLATHLQTAAAAGSSGMCSHADRNNINSHNSSSNNSCCTTSSTMSNTSNVSSVGLGACSVFGGSQMVLPVQTQLHTRIQAQQQAPNSLQTTSSCSSSSAVASAMLQTHGGGQFYCHPLIKLEPGVYPSYAPENNNSNSNPSMTGSDLFPKQRLSSGKTQQRGKGKGKEKVVAAARGDVVSGVSGDGGDGGDGNIKRQRTIGQPTQPPPQQQQQEDRALAPALAQKHALSLAQAQNQMFNACQTQYAGQMKQQQQQFQSLQTTLANAKTSTTALKATAKGKGKTNGKTTTTTTAAAAAAVAAKPQQRRKSDLSAGGGRRDLDDSDLDSDDDHGDCDDYGEDDASTTAEGSSLLSPLGAAGNTQGLQSIGQVAGRCQGQSKKRKHNPNPDAIAIALATEDTLRQLQLDPNSKDGKKKKRQIRNRMSAQFHRDRKNAYIADLESSVRRKDAEIAALRSELAAAYGGKIPASVAARVAPLPQLLPGTAPSTLSSAASTAAAGGGGIASPVTSTTTIASSSSTASSTANSTRSATVGSDSDDTDMLSVSTNGIAAVAAGPAGAVNKQRAVSSSTLHPAAASFSLVPSSRHMMLSMMGGGGRGGSNNGVAGSGIRMGGGGVMFPGFGGGGVGGGSSGVRIPALGNSLMIISCLCMISIMMLGGGGGNISIHLPPLSTTSSSSSSTSSSSPPASSTSITITRAARGTAGGTHADSGKIHPKSGADMENSRGSGGGSGSIALQDLAPAAAQVLRKLGVRMESDSERDGDVPDLDVGVSVDVDMDVDSLTAALAAEIHSGDLDAYSYTKIHGKQGSNTHGTETQGKEDGLGPQAAADEEVGNEWDAELSGDRSRPIAQHISHSRRLLASRDEEENVVDEDHDQQDKTEQQQQQQQQQQREEEGHGEQMEIDEGIKTKEGMDTAVDAVPLPESRSSHYYSPSLMAKLYEQPETYPVKGARTGAGTGNESKSESESFSFPQFLFDLVRATTATTTRSSSSSSPSSSPSEGRATRIPSKASLDHHHQQQQQASREQAEREYQGNGTRTHSRNLRFVLPPPTALPIAASATAGSGTGTGLAAGLAAVLGLSTHPTADLSHSSSPYNTTTTNTTSQYSAATSASSSAAAAAAARNASAMDDIQALLISSASLPASSHPPASGFALSRDLVPRLAHSIAAAAASAAGNGAVDVVRGAPGANAAGALCGYPYRPCSSSTSPPFSSFSSSSSIVMTGGRALLDPAAFLSAGPSKGYFAFPSSTHAGAGGLFPLSAIPSHAAVTTARARPATTAGASTSAAGRKEEEDELNSLVPYFHSYAEHDRGHTGERKEWASERERETGGLEKRGVVLAEKIFSLASISSFPASTHHPSVPSVPSTSLSATGAAAAAAGATALARLEHTLDLAATPPTHGRRRTERDRYSGGGDRDVERGGRRRDSEEGEEEADVRVLVPQEQQQHQHQQTNTVTIQLPASMVRLGKSWGDSSDGGVDALLRMFDLSPAHTPAHTRAPDAHHRARGDFREEDSPARGVGKEDGDIRTGGYSEGGGGERGTPFRRYNISAGSRESEKEIAQEGEEERVAISLDCVIVGARLVRVGSA